MWLKAILRKVFGGHDQMRRTGDPPVGWSEGAPQSVELEEPVPAPRPPKSSAAKLNTFGIVYASREGEITRRVITLISRRVYYSRETWIAYCHLRKASRTFVAANIVSLFDPDTGESLTIDDVASRAGPDSVDPILDAGADEPLSAPFRTIAQAHVYFSLILAGYNVKLETRRANLSDFLDARLPRKKGQGFLKSASASIWFEPVFVNFDENQNVVAGNLKDNPWVVSGPNGTRSFSRASEAADAFEAAVRAAISKRS